MVTGGPVLVTFAWVLCKSLTDDKLCWMGKDSEVPYYVYTVPILIVLLVGIISLQNLLCHKDRKLELFQMTLLWV